jgi:hypothetical protein
VGLKVELRPISLPEHELEEIVVTDVNGTPRRVGFCPTPDGSCVRFVRIPNDDAQRAEVVAEVTRQRTERGLSTDSRSSVPPDPSEIRAALKKEKRGS